jgi:hypothetical protein
MMAMKMFKDDHRPLCLKHHNPRPRRIVTRRYENGTEDFEVVCNECYEEKARKTASHGMKASHKSVGTWDPMLDPVMPRSIDPLDDDRRKRPMSKQHAMDLYDVGIVDQRSASILHPDQNWTDIKRKALEDMQEADYKMGIDWGKTSENIEKLNKAAQEAGEAMVTATQSVEELNDELRKLTCDEQKFADACEDAIEFELDKPQHAGKDMIEVSVFPPSRHENIREYLFDRYKGWTIKCKDGDPVWEFHAR